MSESDPAGTWKLTVATFERARLVIRAAELREQGRSYRAITRELGLDSPFTARWAVNIGYEMAEQYNADLGADV